MSLKYLQTKNQYKKRLPTQTKNKLKKAIKVQKVDWRNFTKTERKNLAQSSMSERQKSKN